MKLNKPSAYVAVFSTSLLLAAGLHACSYGRVEGANTELYQQLPKSMHSQNLPERELKIRVAEGKVAKFRTDLKELEDEIHLSYKDVEDRRAEVGTLKQQLRDLKKAKAAEGEIAQMKREIKLAKHREEIAREIYHLRQQQKKTVERQIEVHEAQQKVLLSQNELDKVLAIHEYTEWKARNAKVEAATFREQVRRFELKESRARHRLSKAEEKQAQVEYNVKILEEADVLKDDRG